MKYTEKLINTSDRFNSIVCMGLDPVIENIPETGPPGKAIVTFYREILNKIIQKSIYPGAVKPNYAFYAQYGIEGIEALSSVIALYRDAGLPEKLLTPMPVKPLISFQLMRSRCRPLWAVIQSPRLWIRTLTADSIY